MRRVLSQLLYAVERHHVHPHSPDGDDPVVRKLGEAERAPRLWPKYWIVFTCVAGQWPLIVISMEESP